MVLNDYTISDVTKLGNASITKIFNFRSNQVTTVLIDEIRDEKWVSVGVSIAAAVSTQMETQNFRDVESQEEIELARSRLLEAGGKPPVARQIPAIRSTNG